jgi:hypothetical protein
MGGPGSPEWIGATAARVGASVGVTGRRRHEAGDKETVESGEQALENQCGAGRS